MTPFCEALWHLLHVCLQSLTLRRTFILKHTLIDCYLSLTLGSHKSLTDPLRVYQLHHHFPKWQDELQEPLSKTYILVPFYFDKDKTHCVFFVSLNSFYHCWHFYWHVIFQTISGDTSTINLFQKFYASIFSPKEKVGKKGSSDIFSMSFLLSLFKKDVWFYWVLLEACSI